MRAAWRSMAMPRMAALRTGQASSIAGRTDGTAALEWKDLRRSGRQTSRHEHRHPSARTGISELVHVVTDASPCLGAHDFVVVLLALLTRCKLLQQIPRKSDANTARYCSFFPPNAARSMKQPFKDRRRRRQKPHHGDTRRKKSVRASRPAAHSAIRPEFAVSQVGARLGPKAAPTAGPACNGRGRGSVDAQGSGLPY